MTMNSKSISSFHMLSDDHFELNNVTFCSLQDNEKKRQVMMLWLEIQQMLNANRTEENLKRGRNRRLIGEPSPSRPAPNGTSIPYTPLAQLPHVRTPTSHF
jgi:hypothetical protein